MNAVERAGVDIAPLVEPHAIRESGRDDCEFALVRNRLAVRRDIECIDRVRLVEIIGARGLDRAAVDDVERLLIGRKRDAVRHLQVACDDAEFFRLRIPAVDIVRQLGLLRELQRTVTRVGEPHRAVGFHNEVVRGVQRLAVERTRKRLDTAVEVRDRDTAAGGFGGEQARLEVGRLTVGDARWVAENHRSVP